MMQLCHISAVNEESPIKLHAMKENEIQLTDLNYVDMLQGLGPSRADSELVRDWSSKFFPRRREF